MLDMQGRGEPLGLRAAIASRIRELHKPFKIYEECGHAHKQEDPGIVYLEDLGYTCKPPMYEICRECCMDGSRSDYQTEVCASYHKHGKDLPICPTMAILVEAEAVNA